MPELANYLSLESLLVQRLLDNVQPDGKAIEVQTAPDLVDVQERDQRTPALHVLYDDYRPTQDQAGGLIQQTEQLWTVVVVVKNARGRGRAAAREDGGNLMVWVTRALQGWTPGPDHTRMRLANPRFRATYRGAFAYFPMTFSTRVQTRGITP